MKYILIIIQILFLYSGLLGQGSAQIDGPSVVCPGDNNWYFINDSRCGLVTFSTWSITNGDLVGTSFGNAAINWNETDVDNGQVQVSYECFPSSGGIDPIGPFNLTLNVSYRKIQTPFFGVASLELPIEDNSWFMLTTPDQGTGFTYSWSFPDCLPGIEADNVAIVTPDLYATGDICLTVYNELCDVSITECIAITRSCIDSKTFFEVDDVPEFTSVETNISTDGNVEPTLSFVEFKAGVSIDLNPGFEANAEFLAHIGECGRAPGSGDCIEIGTFDWFVGGNLIEENKAPILQDAERRMEKNPLSGKNENIKMKVYPNPTSDNFTIAIDHYNLNEKHTFEILSLNGQLLRTGPILDQKTVVDIGELDKGIYLVKVSTSSDLSVIRLVKL